MKNVFQGFVVVLKPLNLQSIVFLYFFNLGFSLSLFLFKKLVYIVILGNTVFFFLFKESYFILLLNNSFIGFGFQFRNNSGIFFMSVLKNHFMLLNKIVSLQIDVADKLFFFSYIICFFFL